MDGEPTSDGTPVPPADDSAPDGEGSTSGAGSPRRRTWNRPTSVAASTLLAVVLGFGLTVQIRNTDEPAAQEGRREEDLVLILDELGEQEEVLRRQIGETRQTIEDLSTGQQQSETAVEEARQRAESIGILNGTLPARGPGVRVTVQDPEGAVPVSVLLDAVQELRGAGAEALQVDGVRVVVSSAITGTPGELRIDGTLLSAPYDIRVVGPTAALEVALNVAGGVVDDVSRVGGEVRIVQADEVVVDALVG
ncbi:DUF881 domain-containing protein [Blastococcus sp. TF02A_35]|uniref:DUF881 domain-containing protein n=1 Tax=Blastococcus sp. TF02A-35 TaxID=2559612 RepID=UPI001074756A|nr:DUF881 domain-containing protein [Blastococcus sp. TF02A_35]TFV53112.1 DUF881 domain-containing protein [Blastococcus sp. TF02A_35]